MTRTVASPRHVQGYSRNDELRVSISAQPYITLTHRYRRSIDSGSVGQDEWYVLPSRECNRLSSACVNAAVQRKLIYIFIRVYTEITFSLSIHPSSLFQTIMSITKITDVH